jgi:hypothetical protein
VGEVVEQDDVGVHGDRRLEIEFGNARGTDFYQVRGHSWNIFGEPFQIGAASHLEPADDDVLAR